MASLLSGIAKPKEVHDNAESLVEMILGDSAPLLRWDPGLQKELVTYMMDAIELDSHMCQQRAWWFCEYPGVVDSRPRYDIPFHRGRMETANCDADDAVSHVALMIRPALMKCGNSAGNNYEAPQIICKSLVHCSKSRRSLNEPTSVDAHQTRRKDSRKFRWWRREDMTETSEAQH